MSHSATPPFETITTLYGGYHRYDFTDHAYLYNLYFPTPEMMEHLKTHIKELVANYPVGQQTLARLVGRWTGDRPEHLAVGNGAAELIKIISGTLDKKIIIPVPGFNEYINAGSDKNIRTFRLDPPFFQLDIQAFGDEAIREKVDIAVVVTPNNPTSLHVPEQEIKALARRLERHRIRLIIDESFIDFLTPQKGEPLGGQLDDFPNTAVIKSMSKAFGICGLRIGYMACADQPFINRIRRGLHIWNINGIAEEFLRILPDYRKEFLRSCIKVMEDRDYLYTLLTAIPGLEVLKPDANFVFCRLPEESICAPDMARTFYENHRILIKDCAGKDLPDANRYLRIASRTKKENDRLAELLADSLSERKKTG
jgi:threonine-phosphate decarboxylase